MARSLTAATVHGLKWSYASSFVNVILQIGVTAVLARVLTPGEFGVVAMAVLFLKFGQYFAQLGVGQAIVQRPELSDTDFRAAFTSALLLGILFTGLFVALAPLTALLFPQTAGVVTIVRVLSLTFFIGGLTATTQALLRRRFAFRAIALTEISTYVAGYASVGLVLALAGFGAWSLVIASLTQAALGAVVYCLLTRHDLGLSLDRTSLKEIYSFGGRVSLIGFGEFVGSNLDTLWTGHYLGSTALGYYTRATNIAISPLFFVTMSLWRVLLPAFSRIQDQLDRLRAAYLQTITVVAVVVVPVSWGVSAAASEVVLTLLGPRWEPSVAVLRVLALAAPFILLTDFAAVVCEATATLNAKIALTIGRIIAMVCFLALLTSYGMVGVAAAYGLSAFVTHIAYVLVTKRRLKMTAAELLRTYTPAAPAGVVVGIVLLALHAGFARLGLPAAAILALQVAAGFAILLFTISRARDGAIWQAVRRRLVDAGYAPQGTGLAAWLIRRVDSLA